MADDVTIGEVARGLEKLEARLSERITLVAAQIDRLQFVPRDTFEARTAAQTDRMDALEARMDRRDDEQSRLRMVIVGSFIFPIIVAVVLAMVVVQ